MWNSSFVSIHFVFCNRIIIKKVKFIHWNCFWQWIECTKKNGYQEWGLLLFLFSFLCLRKTNLIACSTYCHILQYTEDEIKTLDDVCRFFWSFDSTSFFFQVAFDIEQLNFDDTNKFPDWRLTVDVELERFRAQYVDSLWWDLQWLIWNCLQPSKWTFLVTNVQCQSSSSSFRMVDWT